jgi:hypothetical protein
VIDGFKTGGITHVVVVVPHLAQAVTASLLACHPHVFIVDQSDISVVRIGVSESGARCAQAVLDHISNYRPPHDDPN